MDAWSSLGNISGKNGARQEQMEDCSLILGTSEQFSMPLFQTASRHWIRGLKESWVTSSSLQHIVETYVTKFKRSPYIQIWIWINHILQAESHRYIFLACFKMPPLWCIFTIYYMSHYGNQDYFSWKKKYKIKINSFYLKRKKKKTTLQLLLI